MTSLPDLFAAYNYGSFSLKTKHNTKRNYTIFTVHQFNSAAALCILHLRQITSFLLPHIKRKIARGTDLTTENIFRLTGGS